MNFSYNWRNAAAPFEPRPLPEKSNKNLTLQRAETLRKKGEIEARQRGTRKNERKRHRGDRPQSVIQGSFNDSSEPLFCQTHVTQINVGKSP
jgi:hypothetical protein